MSRAVATWEEAHEVVKGIEETNAGQKALNNSTLPSSRLERMARRKENRPTRKAQSP